MRRNVNICQLIFIAFASVFVSQFLSFHFLKILTTNNGDKRKFIEKYYQLEAVAFRTGKKHFGCLLIQSKHFDGISSINIGRVKRNALEYTKFH